MLVLINILGLIAIVLLGTGLWTLLTGLIVGGMTLLLAALEGDGGEERPDASERSTELAVDRVLHEIEESKRVIDSIDAEIREIKGGGQERFADVVRR